VLSAYALNRSLLARQGLLERRAAGTVAMLEQLVGMQAQIPGNPFVGLWSRLEGFDPEELSALVRRGDAVRGHLMRTTVHLATARDHDALWPHTARGHARLFRGTFLRRLNGEDPEAVIAAGRALLAEAPRTKAELAAALAPSFPAAEPDALGYAVALNLPLVQAPPRGEWGASAAARMALREPAGGTAIDAVVRRYLAAFGPATAADVRTWSGFTGAGEVLERLDLVELEDGLVDVPDAPWPDPGTPAPPRFLPEYDNVLLSHADRARIVPERLPLPRGATRGFVLVDGFATATWRFADGRVEVLGADGPDVRREADALAAFLSSAG
jgi:hypothetical protein